LGYAACYGIESGAGTKILEVFSRREHNVDGGGVGGGPLPVRSPGPGGNRRGTGVATVRRGIRDLKKAGLIETEQRYRKKGGKSSLLFRLKKE